MTPESITELAVVSEEENDTKLFIFKIYSLK
jgi:hypothetical protein